MTRRRMMRRCHNPNQASPNRGLLEEDVKYMADAKRRFTNQSRTGPNDEDRDENVSTNQQSRPQPQPPTEAQRQNQANDQAVTNGAQAEIEQLIAELDAERAKSTEYLEQAQRSRAELVNYRRRTEQEIEQIRQHAGERLITRILPVIDDFHRALDAVPAEERDNSWLQGVLLIERKLWTIMESEGVRPIEAVGKRFDPSLHEAVTVEDGAHGAETVVAEFQRGYTLHDRVIRPSMVKVGNPTK